MTCTTEAECDSCSCSVSSSCISSSVHLYSVHTCKGVCKYCSCTLVSPLFHACIGVVQPSVFSVLFVNTNVYDCLDNGLKSPSGMSLKQSSSICCVSFERVQLKFNLPTVVTKGSVKPLKKPFTRKMRESLQGNISK